MLPPLSMQERFPKTTVGCRELLAEENKEKLLELKELSTRPIRPPKEICRASLKSTLPFIKFLQACNVSFGTSQSMRSRRSKEVIPVLQETGRSLSVVLVPFQGSLDGSLTNFKGRIRVKVDFSRPRNNGRRLTVSPSKSELFPILQQLTE